MCSSPRLFFAGVLGRAFAVALGLALPVSTASGQPSDRSTRGEIRPGFTFSADASRAFGDTRYTTDALTPDPRDPDVLVPIRSVLVFPLDMPLLGLRAQWMPGRTPWSFGAGLKVNLDDPSSAMTDSDFFQEKQVFFGESVPADVTLLLATADVRYRLDAAQPGTFDLTLRFEYERVEQYIVGFEGWQGSLFSDTRVPVVETAPALDYVVNYLSSQVGTAARIDFGPRVGLTLTTAGGLLYAWDRDDHLLRDRLSEGSAFGYTLHSSGRLGYRTLVFGATALSIDLWGELRYYRAEGGVDQSWYSGSSTGTRYTDLPYTLESLQPQVGFGLTFTH